MPLGTIALRDPFIPPVPLPIAILMPLPRENLSVFFSSIGPGGILLLGIPSKGSATGGRREKRAAKHFFLGGEGRELQLTDGGIGDLHADLKSLFFCTRGSNG